MADKIPIQAHQICLGAVVPCDIFAADGRLLLRAGLTIDSDRHLARLLDEGVYDPDEARRAGGFANAAGDGQNASAEAGSLRRTFISVVSQLNSLVLRLESTLTAPDAATFEPQVRVLVEEIQQCCIADSDAALAQILMSDTLRYSIRHQVNAAVLTAVLGRRLPLDAEQTASAVAAALTMNLSIVALQDELVMRKEALTIQQRASIRRHPLDGALALQQLGIRDDVWLKTVLQHHEAWDGSGYPGGLQAQHIVRTAQVVALADRYCALVSSRTYRTAVLPRAAIREIHDRMGAEIDRSLISCLVSSLGVFPPGSLVRLANGETGIVARRLLDPRHPVVYALQSANGVAYGEPRKRMTSARKEYEITGDVAPHEVYARMDPEQIWPPGEIEFAQTAATG